MNINRFILYGLLSFAPLLIPVVIIIPGLILNIVISPSLGEGAIHFIFIFILVTLVPLGLMIVSYLLCLKHTSRKARFTVILITWEVLAFCALYIVIAAVGGTSMAVVDGGTHGRSFTNQILESMFVIFIAFQVFISIWVAFVTSRIGRILD